MKPKVLVVDDEAETLTLLDYVLCGAGFEVATAANGTEALTKASEFQPDVVLLDIQLPDVDGFAVCERLRSQPAPAEIPVILFSNHSGIAVRARGLEAGSRQCLTKTEGLEAVIGSLRQAVEDKFAATADGKIREQAGPDPMLVKNVPASAGV